MVMSDKSSSNLVKSFVPDLKVLTATATSQIQAWVDAQGKCLEEVQQFGQRWLDRRQEAIRDCTEMALKGPTGRPDASDAYGLMQEGLTKSMKRLALDVEESVALAARCRSQMWPHAATATATAEETAQAGGAGKMAAA